MDRNLKLFVDVFSRMNANILGEQLSGTSITILSQDPKETGVFRQYGIRCVSEPQGMRSPLMLSPQTTRDILWQLNRLQSENQELKSRLKIALDMINESPLNL